MKTIEDKFDAELEKFEAKKAKMQVKIDAQLAKARAALNKAEEISEEYGIPFSSDLSPLGQSYKPGSFEEKWPKSFDKKWRKVNSHVVDELMVDSIPEFDGWEYSRVCYG